MKNYSLYIDSPLLRRGRKLGVLAADFFLCLILSLLLFFASDAIHTASGAYDGIGDGLSQNEAERIDMIEEAHLGKRGSDGTLSASYSSSSVYLLRLTYASLLQAGASKQEISAQTYQGYEPLTPEEDPCHYYCSRFKIEKADRFEPSSYDLNYYLQTLKGGRETYFLEEGYPYLSEEVATQIDESYRKGSYAEGRAYREELESLHTSLLREATADFESHYLPYKDSLNTYQNTYKGLLKIKVIESLQGYTLAGIILFLLLPLLLKDGRTLGCLAFHAAYRGNDKKEVAFYQITLRFLLLFIEFVGVGPLSLLLVYGTEAMTILSLPLLGQAPCFSLLVYSGLAILISYALSFFGKERKQTLSELAARMVLIDRRGING